MISNELKKKVDALSPQERDDIYRYLWSEHVRSDVKAKLKEYEDLKATEEEIDNIVYRYVYQGEYDCNKDYWANLEYLIEDETGYSEKK